MLSRPHRVTKDEIGSIIKHGRTYHSPKASLRVFSFKGPSAFAVVVSAKVASKAVARNKIKRRIRSILRKNLPQIVSGHKAVFFVKKDGVAASFKELEADIVYLLEQSRLLKNN